MVHEGSSEGGVLQKKPGQASEKKSEEDEKLASAIS